MLRSSSTRAIVGMAYLLLIVRLLRLRSPEMGVSQCFEVLSKDNWQCKLAAMANWQSERHGLLTQRAGRSFHCLCNARNWRFGVRVSLQFPNVFLRPCHSLSPLSFLSHLILPKQQVSNTSKRLHAPELSADNGSRRCEASLQVWSLGTLGRK